MPYKRAADAVIAKLEAIKRGQEGVVGDAAGVVAQVLSRWKNRRQAFNPQLDTLELLAAALGLTMSELFADVQPEPESLPRAEASAAPQDDAVPGERVNTALRHLRLAQAVLKGDDRAAVRLTRELQRELSKTSKRPKAAGSGEA